MKLVIDIPKELYESYKGKPPMLGDAGMDIIAQSIANGTSLVQVLDELKAMKNYYTDSSNNY